MDELYTADIQCLWAYVEADDEYRPRFLVEHPLPQGAGHSDLTEEYRAARNLGAGDSYSRIQHVPLTYVDALLADTNVEVVIYGIELS